MPDHETIFEGVVHAADARPLHKALLQLASRRPNANMKVLDVHAVTLWSSLAGAKVGAQSYSMHLPHAFTIGSECYTGRLNLDIIEAGKWRPRALAYSTYLEQWPAFLSSKGECKSDLFFTHVRGAEDTCAIHLYVDNLRRVADPPTRSSSTIVDALAERAQTWWARFMDPFYAT